MTYFLLFEKHTGSAIKEKLVVIEEIKGPRAKMLN
jgi:hypothetical protein